ncbi:GyrI-like domain-containing protein [Fusibacter sp. 3D3]|uniref:GyrI-like domain-containing protein n=1 Tax=Fusibacter sp. 3D3 TaxID=1048380 RepID=UPI000853BDBE|nr:GyrI-like domain-containing protein [Fusibacter sp. 3D3]GAU76708.1 transcriptional regulator [Fusibacter sp. 3D3]
MNYEIVTLEDITVVGQSIMTTNENGQAMYDIGAMWQKFISEGHFERIEHKTTGEGIGLYTDYEGDVTNPYRFMCCVAVSKGEQSGFETRTIAGGKYAKFTVIGDAVESVGKAWQAIWAMDLKRKYAYDFELYHNENGDMDHQTIDIYIGLE